MDFAPSRSEWFRTWRRTLGSRGDRNCRNGKFEEITNPTHCDGEYALRFPDRTQLLGIQPADGRTIVVEVSSSDNQIHCVSMGDPICRSSRSSGEQEGCSSLGKHPQNWIGSLSGPDLHKFGSLQPHGYPAEMVRMARDKCRRSGQCRKRNLKDCFGADIWPPDLRGEIAHCERHGKSTMPLWRVTLI
jgi:hypothetical protein